MTDRERIPTVLKEQIALCGKDGERERIIVYLTSDDAQRIVDWLEGQDTVEYALDTLRRHGWKEDGYGDLLEAEKTEFVYDEYGTPACKECGYSKSGHGTYDCKKRCASDTIAMLKEQEPVKPREEKCGKHWDLDVWTYVCGECGSAIDTVDVYCRHCGKKVKWE